MTKNSGVPAQSWTQGHATIAGHTFVYRRSEMGKTSYDTAMTTQVHNIKAFCELSEDGQLIEVYFKYNRAAVDSFKDALRGSGRKFVAEGEYGAHWTIPKTLDAANKLRTVFGDNLELGAAVRAWGKQTVALNRRHRRLAESEDHPVSSLRIARTHPKLAAYLRPYQRSDVALMAETNVLNCNGMGCLAADTIVEIHRAGKSFKTTIDKLYRRFNGIDRYHWRDDIPTMIRSRYPDGTIRLSTLESALISGVQKTVIVATTKGRKIRSTTDHPFLTPSGWVEAGQLSSGDEVYVDGGQTERFGRGNRDRSRMVKLAHHPNAHKHTRSVAIHRLIIEADMNGMTYDEFVSVIRGGSAKYSKRLSPPDLSHLKFLPSEMVVHHKDEDHSHNVLSNLEVQNGHSDHAKLHSADNWRNCAHWTTTERIESVTPYGSEQTYDLALADDPHNFLANGFVVHNTGKTVEILAALAESGHAEGAHLIIAPVRSLENVWRPEIERWMPGTVYTAEDPTERREAVSEGLKAVARGETAWILINIEMVRVKRMDEDDSGPYVKADHKGVHYAASNELHSDILGVNWTSLIIDEFHTMGLPERKSLATLGTSVIKSERRFLLSGTPMGGKPYKLFSPLRSIDPKRFSDYWRWCNEWLEVETEKVQQKGKKQGVTTDVMTVGGIKPGREEAFYAAHAGLMIRRLKRDALPGLPEKVRIIVSCGMTTNQKRQYLKFEADAEVRVEGGMISADNRLAEFTRLKQFANAYCTLDANGLVQPTEQSAKLPLLLDKLAESGVAPIRYRAGKPLAAESQTYEPGARAIVSSQSSRMVEMTAAWLHKKGIECDTLTGDTKDSRPIIKRFQDGSDTPYVICMTTATGGVSLNLEAAGSVHILDESWNPDVDLQLEDRGDRSTRTTPLIVLIYRTEDSIQEYIAEVAGDKEVTNKNVLDFYRAGKAKKGKAS